MECSDSPNPWLASGLTYICIDSDSPTHNRTERSGRQIDSDKQTLLKKSRTDRYILFLSQYLIMLFAAAFEMSLIFAIRVCAGQLWSVHSHNNKLQQLF